MWLARVPDSMTHEYFGLCGELQAQQRLTLKRLPMFDAHKSTARGIEHLVTKIHTSQLLMFWRGATKVFAWSCDKGFCHHCKWGGGLLKGWS